MNEEFNSSNKQSLSRRGFVKSSVIYGALITSKTTRAHGQGNTPSDTINVAMIGCGAQGSKQFESITGTNFMTTKKLAVPGVNFVAACDIHPFYRDGMVRKMKSYGFQATGYEDYREMLDKQKEIQAVLIATPDFMHHVHTRDALKAGKDVYCEKMMSNTVETAKDMVLAQRETGLLLQIGHQRRSNPRYLALKHELLQGRKIFGRITHASAQWNRSTASGKITPAPKVLKMLTPELLAKYGYANGEEFFNWRFYKKYGGGPISDLGAHQIDIFNWMFDATPVAMVASGGVNYYNGYEHNDNVMAIYDYVSPLFVDQAQSKDARKDEASKTIRAYYQVLTTTGSLGFFEKFMGDKGSVEISEIPKVNQAYPETGQDEIWKNEILGKRWSDPFSGRKQALLMQDVEDIKYNPWDVPKTWGGPPKKWQVSLRGEGGTDSRVSKALAAWELGTALNALPHTPHLQNFFDAVRITDKVARVKKLNCPVEDAFRTCVTVLACNQAIAEGRRIQFKPEDFVVPTV